MNKIKHLILLTVAVTLAACATTTPEAKVSRMATVARVAANAGTTVALLKHPEDAVKFKAALQALNLLIHDGKFDPISLRSALSELPIKELRSDEGAIIVDAAIVLFDAYAAEIIDLDKVKYLKPVIVAIRDGLEAALSRQPPR